MRNATLEMIMASVADETGRVSRPFGVAHLIVPRQIHLREGGLIWGIPDTGPDPTPEQVRNARAGRTTPDTWPKLMGLPMRVRTPRDLLERFVRLENAAPEDILRFATRYGVIGECQHGLPASHLPFRIGESHGCLPQPHLETAGTWAFDSLAIWRRYVHQALLILRAAGWVAAGHREETDEFTRDALEELEGLSGSSLPPSGTPTLARARIAMSAAVSRWLDVAAIGPRMTFWGRSPHVLIGTHADVVRLGCSLFPALAMQLLSATGRLSIHFCITCGVLFDSLRPRKYCDACKDRGRWNNAQRKYRKKKK